MDAKSGRHPASLPPGVCEEQYTLPRELRAPLSFVKLQNPPSHVRMETLNSRDPKPTAEVPLLEGMRLQWTKCLLRGDSYYEMQGLIHDMGEGAAGLPSYLVSKYGRSKRYDDDDDDEYVPDDSSSTSQEEEEPILYHTRTERFLKTGMDRPQNFTIFQCIPRDMLKSLALGTVAYDYFPRGSSSPRGGYKVPKKGGYGIYVFGLAVKDRQGKWMTATELKVLIQNLERYVEAYDAWSGNDDSWPVNRRSRILRAFVNDVDNRIGKHDVSGPRYITSDAVKEGMTALISSLQRRVVESLKLDPTGSTQLIQTPLYVGLSTKLADRMPKHDPTSKKSRALENSNKEHGLVCSLMKVQGLGPQAVSRVVLLLWDKEDLWLWETLVCAIANGLISQDGFNRTECGSRVHSNGPSIDPDAEDIVKVHHRYLYENSEATLAYLRERRALSDRHQKFQSAINDGVIEEAKGVRGALEQSGRDVKGLRDHLRLEEEQLELERKRTRAADEALEVLDLLKQLSEIDLSVFVTD